MAALLAIEELGAHLIAQGITSPYASAPGALPSLWLNPRDGAPLPRDGEPGTITLVEITIASDHDLAPWVEISFIATIARYRTERYAQLAQRQLRDLIAPRDQLEGRKQWQMGALPVMRSKVFRPDQPVEASSVAYTRSQAFQFDCARSALAGTP